MTDEESSNGEGPPKHFQQMQNQMMREQFAERRTGKFAGAGPKGSQMLSHSDLPDDSEALKQMYLELQRTLKDTHAHHQNEKERLRWGDEDTLEDILTHIWKRGLEMGGVIAALIFLTTLLAPEQFTQQQRILGVIALTTVWERYLREFAHDLGQAIQQRIAG